MRRFCVIACAVAATLALAAAAGAAAPDHETLKFPYQFVDTGTGTLQLHQSNVGTLTANGTTLRQDDHYTIFVDIVDGVPVTAKHVGVLEKIFGPDGPVHFRTGQAVFEVVFDPVLGFYVDGPLVTRHGLRHDFDPVAFCAVFV
jgi:hypothetical protein